MDTALSACLIVKDEENNIENCLESIRKYVDEILVVDTGSTDRTVELARKYADRILHFKWIDDFSAARNFSLEKAKHDFVFIIDADNTVLRWNENEVKVFVEKSGISDTGYIKIISTIRDADTERLCNEHEIKLFNRQYFRYNGIIHEQVVSKSGEPFNIVNLDITLSHSGYNFDVMENKKKAERNIRLVETALTQKGDDCYLLYQLGKSYDSQKKYKEAAAAYSRAVAFIRNYDLIYVRMLIIAYGYALINIGSYKEAMQIEKYQSYYECSPDFNFILAHVYMMNGMLSKAIAMFLKCTGQTNAEEEGTTSWMSLYNVGVIYECSGNFNKALEYYRQCGDYPKAQKRIDAILNSNK